MDYRNPVSKRFDGMKITYDAATVAESGWVVIAQGGNGKRVALPPHMTIRVDRPALPAIVELLVVTKGRPARARCTEVRILARRVSGELTSADLRRVPVTSLVREASLIMAVNEQWEPTLGHPTDEQRARQAVSARGDGARWRLDAEHLQTVADTYRAAMAGPSPRPVQAVADRFKVNPHTARRWVVKAREAGILKPAPGARKPGESKGTR